MNMRKIILSIAALIVAVATCNPTSEKTPDKYCTGLHPNNFGDHCHGADPRDAFNTCSNEKCHGSDLMGGNTKGPSCTYCHGDYYFTHSVNYEGYYHHRLVRSSGPTYTTCKGSICHGDDLTSGTTGLGPKCNKCHGFPPEGDDR